MLDRSCFTDEISGTVSDFRLNAYERSYLREYFQLANDSDMTRVLTHIRENHVPVGTALADIPNRIFTENVRTSVMQMLGRPFDSVRWDYYNDLLAVNVELTREDRIKFLSLNSLLVAVARNDQAYLSALGFSSLYGTSEFKTQYRAYATRLLAPPATAV